MSLQSAHSYKNQAESAKGPVILNEVKDLRLLFVGLIFDGAI
jgi:hypothetical protein